MKLSRSAACGATPQLASTFIEEVQALPAGSLPLEAAMAQGNMVSGEPLQVMVNGIDADDHWLRIRAGIFFSSVIAGCSCADDPTPIDTLNEYAELDFRISLVDGETSVTLGR